MTLNYVIWDVNPYIFTFPENFPLLGGRPVAWYGLLWALVFVVGYYVMRKMYRKENLSDELLDKLTIYMLVFSVVGARLGHCLFYEPEYYLADPIKILYVWEGGLASHGGAIGILLGLLLYSRKTKISYLHILDLIVVPTALGGAFIRLGNLMNSEIYGYETTLPWGFKFVRDWAPGTPIDAIPACHPTQIYEALVCLIVFVILLYFFFKKDYAKTHPGFLFGLFCTVVFGTRILIEFIKQPQVEFENSMVLDMGQWLSIPFVIVGIFFIVTSYKKS
ncbi:MAG: prolipoprotein diacylglyceryl transferase [Bacteroidales bacterium]|nr:prolipoprotein diacylglyceryl transferase [Bacteroidales bacterium]MBQ7533747.1 prolipoprotein diacylglyceryl transferase [Bacteroidales bacterium]